MPYRKTLFVAAIFAVAIFPHTEVGAQVAPRHRIMRAPGGNIIPTPVTGSTRLPVRRVSLYKSGIGFFEHIGTVKGNERVTIDFTTAQLNDVLQSLTAIDVNGGHIAGAGYNSTTPFDQQLKALPLPLGEDPTAADFYQAIRGARIEVHSGGLVFAGRLLSVEVRNAAGKGDDKGGGEGDGAARPIAVGPPLIEKRYLTVIADSGAVRSIELTSTTEVRLLDTDLHQDVTRYLQLLASTRSQGLRHLTLDANGSGMRELHVSYISEVPVWKSTYRILFTDAPGTDAARTGAAKTTDSSSSAGAKTATLQGWAVVDNTVGTDWENVELSLIAGAPQSFIQPISQPYYTRRPEIPMPEDAQLTPQTHESGDDKALAQYSVSPKSIAMSGPPSPSSMNGALGGVIGSVGGPISGRSMASQSVSVDTAPMIDYEEAATASTNPNTKTAAFDDYFEYKLTDPITIRKNESALVPILQTKVDAERVTLWSPSQPQPLRALWIKNNSNLTLDRGSFSIVEDGRFGGEGLLEVVHPNERRLLSYAADQAIRVTTDQEKNTHRLQQVTISKGVLTERTVETAGRDYLVHNAAPEPRRVVVEHPIRQGWDLDSDVKPAETTSTTYRFDLLVAAGQTARLHVVERHTLSQRFQLVTLDESQLGILLRTDGDTAGIAPRIRQQLSPIIDARRKLADIDALLAAKQTAIDEIGSDQKRLRDNLAALKGSSEERDLVRRYTGELNQQEDKLAALRKDQETLRQQRTAAELELNIKIQSLQMDEKMD